MRRPPAWVWALLAVVVVVAAVLAFALLHKSGGSSDEAEAQPTATVTLAPVRAETLATTVRAYGVIQPAADAAVTVAAPRAAVVTRLLVGLGQQVRAGQPLLTLADAPATLQAYRQAADAVSFAETDLARVQRLAAEHLAANDQVSAAQKSLADARAALAAQQAQGAGRAAQTLTASAASVITAVSAKPGDRVAQDAPLLTLARAGALVAALNVQSDAAGALRPGQGAAVASSFGGAPLELHLAAVGGLSDPSTRAVQAIAPVPAGAFPIGEAVQADITVGSHPGLVVPRAALVFDETGPHVFTVAGGKAHRVFVKAGADHGPEIEVTGPLAAEAMVAVQGAYELQDGMSVRAAGR
jgi:RND family efflux transporter MFP subunit